MKEIRSKDLKWLSKAEINPEADDAYVHKEMGAKRTKTSSAARGKKDLQWRT
jgi:hypothetical protein